jgi:hypothetical protein
MADTGWLTATNARNIDLGHNDWVNPLDARTLAAPYSYVQVATTEYSNRLNLYTFGASVPAGATINGIEVKIHRNASIGNMGSDDSVYLMNDTATKGNNKASAATWPTSAADAFYGGSADLWGASWTAAQINASTFGAALVGKNIGASTFYFRVDVIQVKIYYTVIQTVSVADTFSLGGVLLGKPTTSAADTLNLSDAMVGNLITSVADTLNLSDIASVGLVIAIADTLSLSDAVLSGPGCFLTDTLSLSDAATLTLHGVAADILSLSDNIAIQSFATASDTLTLNDSLQIICAYIVLLSFAGIAPSTKFTSIAPSTEFTSKKPKTSTGEN